jgi:hypothetical protein
MSLRGLLVVLRLMCILGGSGIHIPDVQGDYVLFIVARGMCTKYFFGREGVPSGHTGCRELPASKFPSRGLKGLRRSS